MKWVLPQIPHGNEMTDVEMLELAAKAAGYEKSLRWNVRFLLSAGGSVLVNNSWQKWNPLNDDGDAFRLSMKLEMMVDPVNRVVAGYLSDINIDIDPELQERDYYGAVRRAIVTAAAEIGKRM